MSLSQDSQELVPAAVQVFGDYKVLVKILSWIYGIPGFPKGTRGPLLVRHVQRRTARSSNPS
jgi:hypothetical protein